MKTAVCALSGGMDSTTLLYHLLDEGYRALAISFDYGQKHRKELRYASRTCRKLGVEHTIIDISALGRILGPNALTDQATAVPAGPYAQENISQTVVPNRNMIFLSIAGGYAVAEKADILAVAVHAGDHAIYPDCRPDFIEKFGEALKAGNFHQVFVHAPFINMSKSEIAALGHKIGVDFSDTWSCYEGGDEPCGVCGTCLERAEALDLIP